MRRLFLRTYAVLAAVVIAGLAVVAAWEINRRGPADPELVEALVQATDDVRAAFATDDPEAARRSVADSLHAEVRVLPLQPLPPLPPPARHRLERGQSVGPRPGGMPELWVPVPDRGLLVHVVPPGHSPPPVPWIAGLVLLGLGIGVATQLRPLERDLQHLADAAARFGEGTRDVRVRLPRGSAAGELGSRFDAMADRIAGLLQSREELLVAVSHELRTPLNRVRFAAELLADEADPAARTEQVEALQRDLDELDALVGELLAWGRLDAGAAARERVSLDPLVTELLADAQRLEPTLQVTSDACGISVLADPRLLRRAVDNLVSNAGRYGAGRISVQVSRREHTVVITVDDDGPGIPVEDRERVKEPFVRLDEARARDGGGVGLGLALVDRIARAHGGSLRIDDSPLGGARFELTLADMA